MRQRHVAGERLFADYADRRVPIYGVHGEESFRAQLFIGALEASGYAYAEATRTQTLPDCSRRRATGSRLGGPS